MNRWIIGGMVGLLGLVALISFMPKAEDTIEITETVVEAREDSVAVNLYKQAKSLEEDRDLISARQKYLEILSDHPDTEYVEEIERNLSKINMDLIFSNTPFPPYAEIHTVVKGDTLGELAKKYKTTVDLIRKSNNIDGDLIRIGQKLRIWQQPFNIFVDKSQNILMLRNGEEIVKVYDVSTGENNSTPVGEFKVVNKLKDPVWFNKGVVVPPDSPTNELGTRWMGFDLPGYGIHGTIKPESIGQQATAGCVRMLNTDVEELFSIVPVGTQVKVVD